MTFKNILLITLLLISTNPAHAQRTGQRLVDSLETVVRMRYIKGDAGEKTQLRYISANTRLGDYYAQEYNHGKLPSLEMAMKYYKAVITLENGTDQDLADNRKAITERNKVLKKVADLYNNSRLKYADPVENINLARLLDVSKIDMHNSITDELQPSAVIKFFYGSPKLTNDAKAALQKMAVLIKSNNNKRFAVFGTGNGSYKMQQLSWEQANAVITYLSEKCGIPRYSFIMKYGQIGPSNNVMLLPALINLENESPAAVPPPFPGIFD